MNHTSSSNFPSNQRSPMTLGDFIKSRKGSKSPPENNGKFLKRQSHSFGGWSNPRNLFYHQDQEQIDFSVNDIEFDKIQQILNQAREVGMINDYYNYLFTSLDLDKVTMPYENVNITGFRLVDQSSPAALRYLKKYPNTGRGKAHSLFSTNALMYDAVHVYARAMNDLGTLQTIETQPLSCEQEGVVWEDGEKILGFLKDVEMVGLTGEIR